MTVKICLVHGLWVLAEQRYAIVSRYNFLTVRVIHRHIFRMGITGITHSKMRSCLFRDQDRQFVRNVIISCHAVSRRVSADRKLAQRQGLMVIKDIVLNVFFILCFRLKVGTVIGCDLAVRKYDLQIFVTEFSQIDLCHMQNTIGSFQDRRCKDFPHRNIDIGHAVFKDRLFCRIRQRMQLHPDICVIVSTSGHMYALSLIQCVNDMLLDGLVFFIV